MYFCKCKAKWQQKSSDSDSRQQKIKQANKTTPEYHDRAKSKLFLDNS